jgi:hypothetical protein
MSGMFGRKLRRFILALGMLFFGSGTTTSVVAQTIWFSPHPAFREGSDYLDLFRPDAPWQDAASRVRVFETGGRFLIDAPDAGLRQMFNDLERRHIAVEIGFEPLSGPGPNNCGFGVEGYGGPMGGGLLFAQRVKALGAKPQFFGMDEPLYFGHVFGPENGRDGCHSSIADIAKDVANKVRQIRTVFPGVPFGEVEPLSFRPNQPWFKDNRWLADLSTWFDAYQAAVGDRLAFFRLDLWWGMNWQAHMLDLTALLARRGIPLQVIYNGDGKTDEIWIASAVSHFKEFETGPWPKPNAAIIQYWSPNPTHVLPEDNPLTGTGLINRYVQWQQTRR